MMKSSRFCGALQTAGGFLLLFFLAQMSFAQERKQEDLAAQARDPTASLTAFQIRYDYTASFYGVSDADQGTIVLQPIIPFKLGELRNIARITVPYVTNAPDFGALSDIDQDPVPPNYVPTKDKSGLGDIALLDAVIFDASWGRWGIGPVLSVPTASDDALGTGKWSLGPAAVGITRVDKLMLGLLGMGLFSVTGDSHRQDVSAMTFQPFANYGLGAAGPSACRTLFTPTISNRTSGPAYPSEDGSKNWCIWVNCL